MEKVVVTDIEIPFVSMVVFMVKWSIAVIPAFLILCGLWGLIGGLTAWIVRILV